VVFIAIEGCIAAGKSTTARLVAGSLGHHLLLEETEHHPFLCDFYSDPARYALETELTFVLLHYHQLSHYCGQQSFVTDFSPVKDLVFARMNLHGDDLAIFESLYSRLAGRLCRPRLTIYLDLPVDVLMARILERGRPYELAIPRTYIEHLSQCYNEHLEELGDLVRVVKVSSGHDPEAVARKVLEAIAAEVRA